MHKLQDSIYFLKIIKVLELATVHDINKSRIFSEIVFNICNSYRPLIFLIKYKLAINISQRL